jgi:hypothetical protein
VLLVVVNLFVLVVLDCFLLFYDLAALLDKRFDLLVILVDPGRQLGLRKHQLFLGSFVLSGHIGDDIMSALLFFLLDAFQLLLTVALFNLTRFGLVRLLLLVNKLHGERLDLSLQDKVTLHGIDVVSETAALLFLSSLFLSAFLGSHLNSSS